MKILFFFLLLCLPAAADSVVGPTWGCTSIGQNLVVEGTGPRVFDVYIPGSMNVPIESQGYLVIDGVFYLTGYKYAHSQLELAAPHEAAITAMKAEAIAQASVEAKSN